MGIADDFMNSFFAAYPDARSGKLTMEELNGLMEEYQRKANSRPIEDFDGLSPEQMNGLLYTPLSPGSILQFREGFDAHVQKSPFFKLSEILLNEIQQAGNLKLTVTGNLPVRICELLCNQNLIHWRYMKYVKKVREDDIPFLWPLKQYLLDEGLVKKRNNALSLTKNGEKLLKERDQIRFALVFNYIASRFHWGNFYGLEDGGKSGQLGWAYSLLLLSKYGNQPRESTFYSLKVIKAFERELWDIHQTYKEHSAIGDYHWAYQARFFESFAHWFGLVDITYQRDDNRPWFDKLIITKSDLFGHLFETKITK